MRAHASLRPAPKRARHPGRRSQRGAARARRLEPQADAESGLAHADRMRETDGGAARPAAGSTACACTRRSRKSSTRGGATARWTIGAPPTAAAGSITSGPRTRSPSEVASIDDRQELPRRRAALRPRAGDGDASSFDAISRAAPCARRSAARVARVQPPSRSAIMSRRRRRGGRIAFQHLAEQIARNADDDRRLARNRGDRRDRVGDQRQFADQRAGADGVIRRRRTPCPARSRACRPARYSRRRRARRRRTAPRRSAVGASRRRWRARARPACRARTASAPARKRRCRRRGPFRMFSPRVPEGAHGTSL